MNLSSCRAADRTPPERGSAALELVMLTPVVLLVIGLVILGGRVQTIRAEVEHAAYDAARQASLARDAATAGHRARAAAVLALSRHGSGCRSVAVTVDTGGFSVPVGRAATVHTTVTCAVSLADVALPALPGTIRLRGSAVSSLDTYRGRR